MLENSVPEMRTRSRQDHTTRMHSIASIVQCLEEQASNLRDVQLSGRYYIRESDPCLRESEDRCEGVADWVLPGVQSLLYKGRAVAS